MTRDEVRRVLNAAKAVNQGIKVSDETVKMWYGAFVESGVGASVDECLRAVAGYFATPGVSPWIGPGDVIGGVRRARRATADETRRADSGAWPVTPNCDPESVGAYLKETRAVTAALADGSLAGERREAYARGEFTLTGCPRWFTEQDKLRERTT